MKPVWYWPILTLLIIIAILVYTVLKECTIPLIAIFPIDCKLAGILMTIALFMSIVYYALVVFLWTRWMQRRNAVPKPWHYLMIGTLVQLALWAQALPYPLSIPFFFLSLPIWLLILKLIPLIFMLL